MDLKELRKEMGLAERMRVPISKKCISFNLNLTLPKDIATRFLKVTEAEGIPKSHWIREVITEKLNKEK